MDLCGSPECIADEVTREDLAKAHLPHHDLVKVRRVIFTRQFGKMDRAAKEALERARAAFEVDETAESEESDDENSDDESGNKESDHLTLPTPVTPKRLSIQSIAQRRGSVFTQTNVNTDGKPTCAVCKEKVTQPCWYCVQCQGTVFIITGVPVNQTLPADATWICTTCDSKGPHEFGNHAATHDLVRCQERVEDSDVSVEGRLATLEEKFSSHETMMDDRLRQIELKVDSRLLRVESLLESLLGKMGVEPPMSSDG